MIHTRILGQGEGIDAGVMVESMVIVTEGMGPGWWGDPPTLPPPPVSSQGLRKMDTGTILGTDEFPH